MAIKVAAELSIFGDIGFTLESSATAYQPQCWGDAAQSVCKLYTNSFISTQQQTPAPLLHHTTHTASSRNTCHDSSSPV